MRVQMKRISNKFLQAHLRIASLAFRTWMDGVCASNFVAFPASVDKNGRITALAIDVWFQIRRKLSGKDLDFELQVLGVNQLENATVTNLQLVVGSKFFPPAIEASFGEIPAVSHLPEFVSIGEHNRKRFRWKILVESSRN
ncbi:hypothetical protein DsansV1_C32g0220671 [Dioscorea sansibarensis]